MIDPKEFYRKMDSLLGDIIEPHGADPSFFTALLNDLEESFGDELLFGEGHLYSENGRTFELIHTVSGTPRFPTSIANDDPLVREVFEHGGFIFENADDAPEWFDRLDNQFVGIVAFRVVSPPVDTFVYVYGLRPGWTREEVAFCLNSIRFTLGYRLRADAVESDIDKAAAIQRSLLPSGPPDFAGFDIAVRSEPAEQVGGDLYDFIELSDDMIGIAIGDASGHGLPAALLVRDVLMGIRMGMGTGLKMLHMLKRLNRVIHATTYSTRFISVFYCELDNEGGILYSNAGHTSGLILHDGRVERLDPTGTIMGPLENIPLLRAFTKLPPDGVLVLYTDGITERVDADGAPFEEEGLIRFVQERCHLSAEDLVDETYEYALSLDHQSDILEDDSTLLIVKRLL
jgi:sigma-B regulation protein RsbU (phosphoserine phosphatase)